MLDTIKRLGRDTAIYGVSTIVGRFLTFILTPLYANILTTAEVGVVATVFSSIAFLNVLFGHGMEGAFMKYRSTMEVGNERQVFSVPFFSLLAGSLLFAALMIWQSNGLASLLGDAGTYAPLVTYAATILCLDTISIVPFASLRLASRPMQFAAIRMGGIIVNVICNGVFLMAYDLGVEGILYSNIISSAFTLILLLPTILPNLTTIWNGRLYAALIQFGLPAVPAGFAAMMIQVIDRPILLALTDISTVGIYQANYRLGIFMMLVVSMFDFAWRPFFLTHAKDPDAKPLFARVLTYFVLLMSGVFLAVSFFLDDIVKLPVFWGHSILPQEYWPGLAIVPVVLLGYMFLGISNTLVAGIYIEKKTKHLPVNTFIGAGVNVAANFILIPGLGIMGAALATLLSYAAMAIALYIMVQSFYPIKYEFGRIAKIAGAGVVVFCLHLLVDLQHLAVLWNVGLLALFAALMYWMRFFERSELKLIGGLFKRQGVQSPPTVDGFSEPK